jgi:hypothetical protein
MARATAPKKEKKEKRYMERQENGMPRLNCRGESTSGGNGGMNGGVIGNACGGEVPRALCEGRAQLSSVYAPMQKWQMLFPIEKALSHGTLFEELYMPLEVERDG